MQTQSSKRHIEIYDTTLRDGAQAEGISFSLGDKLLVAERLTALGFDYIEGGYPSSNEKDFQFFQKVKDLDLGRTRIAAFGMTRRKGVRAEDDPGLKTLSDCSLGWITLVGKSSLFQVTEVLRATREENLAMIADSVGYLCENGQDVTFDAEHFFDGWRLDADYGLEAIRAAVEAGASMVVLCDTNGGTMPDQIARITATVVDELSVPIGIHCHNDCDLAVANSLAAVEAGASQVQGTINGFGERCGNADLLPVIANLALKMGDRYDLLTEEALADLTDLSRFVYEIANVGFRSHQPFVGRSAFAHKGGMHVSGVNRHASAYEHIDPVVVGNERRVLISELSGRSNIAARAEKYNIRHDVELMDKILAAVVSKESEGYQYEAAEGSFDLLVRRCTGTFKPHFRRLDYHVDVRPDFAEGLKTEATVEVQVADEIRHVVAKGDGPVNALDNAFRKALLETFESLDRMDLVDYKVRVINFEAHTAAKVRVLIESQDEDDVWGTIGVSENIIEASLIALIDSYEYKLCKDDEKS
ncbi:MAG: citramalate synthase [Planctomycetota bacterium]|jgi:2-isopropylmalate synthase